MIITDKEWLKEKRDELKSVVDDLFYTIECKERELIVFHRANEKVIEFLKKEKKKHQNYSFDGDYDCILSENKHTTVLAEIGITKKGKSVPLSKKESKQLRASMECDTCKLFDKIIDKLGGDT